MPGCVIEVSLIQCSCAVVQRLVLLLRISWHWCAASFHLPLTWINPVSPPDRSSMSSPEICVAPCGFSSSSSLSFNLLYHHFFALLLALCKSFPVLDLQPFFIHSISSFQLFLSVDRYKAEAAWGGSCLTASTRDWQLPATQWATSNQVLCKTPANGARNKALWSKVHLQ